VFDHGDNPLKMLCVSVVQITREMYGIMKTIELIPNGSQIAVTQENK